MCTPKVQAARTGPCRAVSPGAMRALLRRIAILRATALCRDTKAAPLPRYKKLYRDTPLWPGSARALPLAPARRLGRVAVLLAVSRHLAMCPNTPTRSYRAPAPLPIVIQSTVSRPKTGKWAVARPVASCKFFF